MQMMFYGMARSKISSYFAGPLIYISFVCLFAGCDNLHKADQGISMNPTQCLPPHKSKEAAISAIDSGLLIRGTSAADFDRLFDTSFRDDFPCDAAVWRVVDFSSQKLSIDDKLAAARCGWYLAVHFSGKGIVDDYYLSNLHK